MLEAWAGFFVEVCMARTRKLEIRLTPAEREAIEIMARRHGQGISELARTLIREAIEARGMPIGLVNLVQHYPALFEADRKAERAATNEPPE